MKYYLIIILSLAVGCSKRIKNEEHAGFILGINKVDTFLESGISIWLDDGIVIIGGKLIDTTNNLLVDPPNRYLYKFPSPIMFEMKDTVSGKFIKY